MQHLHILVWISSADHCLIGLHNISLDQQKTNFVLKYLELYCASIGNEINMENLSDKKLKHISPISVYLHW